MRPFFSMLWDETDGEASAYAANLARKVKASEFFPCQVQEDRGLSVFAGSSESGRRTITPFRSNDGKACGVVLGALFETLRSSRGTYRQARLTPEAMARIFRTQGASIFSDFWGSYIAFIRTDQHSIVLCEPMASIPCYIAQRSGVTLVFSDLEKCSFIERSGFSINYNFISDLLVYDKIQNGATGLNEVQELLGGQRLVTDQSGSSVSQIWDPRDAAKNVEDLPLDEAACRLRDVGKAVLRTHADRFDQVTVNASGGLDSTIVLCGLADPNRRYNLSALHHEFESEDTSEIHFAQAAARHAGVELHSVKLEPARRLPDIDTHPLTVRPFRQFIGLDVRRQLAEFTGGERSAEFTGQGGDHLFLATKTNFGFIDYMRRHLMGRHAFAELVNSAKLSETSVWEVLWKTTPYFWKRHIQKDLRLSMERRLTRLNAAAFQRLDPDAVFPEWTRSSKGLPPGKFDQVHELLHMLQLREPFSVESTSELVHPLLSQPLVELCLRFPVYLLCSDGRSRGLARRAFADDIPDSIRRRMMKGSASGYFMDYLAANIDQIIDEIRGGELVASGLIELSEVERFVSNNEFRTQSYGRMLFICYVIEAWLRTWKRALRTERMVA